MGYHVSTPEERREADNERRVRQMEQKRVKARVVNVRSMPAKIHLDEDWELWGELEKCEAGSEK